MTFLGCIDTAPVTPLPVPVLAKPVPQGTPSGPGMKLSWFCPPYGVQRFELLVAGFPTPPLSTLSALLVNTGAPAVSIIITNFGTNLSLPFYSFITPVIGSEFGGTGPDFEVPCRVEEGKLYAIQVRALGKNGNAGDFSLIRTFLWAPTNAVLPEVPWRGSGFAHHQR